MEGCLCDKTARRLVNDEKSQCVWRRPHFSVLMEKGVKKFALPYYLDLEEVFVCVCVCVCVHVLFWKVCQQNLR